MASESNSTLGPSNERPPYTVIEEPLGTAKRVRIIGIGAGASGINMIRTLRLTLPAGSFTHVVYEKDDGVGGTWLENRYPGCRCDIPSHNYQFSWRKNPAWSNFFSPAEEIHAYLEGICREEEGMMDVIRTGYRVVGASWDEGEGLWRVKVEDLRRGEVFDDHAHFLLDASGILNNWKWPDVPGRDDFRGQLIHTAHWPKDFDHTGKTVVVIGNGASGVQVVPAIQPAAKKLYHIARSPTWVAPPRVPTFAMVSAPAREVLSRIEMDEDENFTKAQIERFRLDPEFYLKFVKTIEKQVLRNSKVHAFATQQVTQFMRAQLGGDERLCRLLIPTWPLGCRRMTPAPGYLPCLTKPNVELRVGGDEGAIRRFVPRGLELVSGEVIEADAVICATGFDLSFCPRFPLVGREGRNLQDVWGRGQAVPPRAYMSCAVAGFPNYFTFFGPNSPIGHGSVFTLSEHIARYISAVILKCQTERIKAVAPLPVAVDDFAAHVDAFMPRTAWASPGCSSWFKGGEGEGPVTALHSGGRMHFFHMLDRFRGEDFEYVLDDTARGNRFAYLGNGFSTRELDEGVDELTYLDP